VRRIEKAEKAMGPPKQKLERRFDDRAEVKESERSEADICRWRKGIKSQRVQAILKS
jgi:hypothetical protein